MIKEINPYQTANTAGTASEPPRRRLLWPHFAWISPLIAFGFFVGTLAIFCGIYEWKEHEAFWIAGVPQTLGIVAGFGVSLLIVFSSARKRWIGVICLVVGVVLNGLMTVSMLEAARMNRNQARADAWFKEKSRQDQIMMKSMKESLFKLKNESEIETDDRNPAPTSETEERTDNNLNHP